MAKQRSIDKITVKSLIDECNISRQTFYYHFRDIMEVVEWSVQQATQNMLSRSLEMDTPEEALNVFISSAVENHMLIRRLLDSQKREQIEKTFVQATRTYLQEMIRTKTPKLSLNYSDMEVTLDFWAYGISGLLFQCCRQEQVDSKKLAGQIYRLVSGKMLCEKR